MTLKFKYFLFIAVIHLLLTFLIFQLLEENKLYFLLAEFGIIISLILSYQVYQSFVRPIDFISSGINAIADKDFNVKFIKTGSKEMDSLVGVYNEMIDNIREERVQVEEQHYFLEKLINASPAGILILDYDNRLAEVNPKAQTMLGLEQGEWRGKELAEIDRELLRQMEKVEVGESVVLSQQGMDLYKCEVSNFVHLGFQRKFVLLQELSKEILAAEKRAYGKVIRMMAHEVNNSIGAINSILTTTLDYCEEEANLDPDVIDGLKVAVGRNDRLNLFMRNFAEVIRLPPAKLNQSSLHTTLRNVATLMAPQLQKRQINLVYELAEKDIFLPLDVQQFEQVLVNALKNAMESIDQNGSIRLCTYPQPPTLIIADDGPGISPEVSDNIFTPFFSTKMDGQGLGLTLSREILINHQAKFSLQTIGEWTEFRVEFATKL